MARSRGPSRRRRTSSRNGTPSTSTTEHDNAMWEKRDAADLSDIAFASDFVKMHGSIGPLSASLTGVFALVLTIMFPGFDSFEALRWAYVMMLTGGIVLPFTSCSAVIHNRLIHAVTNWKVYPTRSLLEWLVWLFSILLVRHAVESMMTASVFSAMLGCTVCYAGEEVCDILRRLRLVTRSGGGTFATAPQFFNDSSLASDNVPLVTMEDVERHQSCPIGHALGHACKGAECDGDSMHDPLSAFPAPVMTADDPNSNSGMSTPAKQETAQSAPCLIVIDNAVLDVGRWAHEHPGGALLLHSLAGCDATDQYMAFHGTSMGKRLRTMCVARVVPRTPTSEETAFRRLRDELCRTGAFRHSFLRGMSPLLIPAALFLAALFGVNLVAQMENTAAMGWILTASALSGLCLGLSWQNIAFLGHDLGHGNVTGIYILDYLLGLGLVPFFGIGITWWKASHNAHHVNCNSESHDPDIQHLPFLAVSRRMLKGFYSYYHGRPFAFDAFARFMTAYQHILYYPIMAFAKFNLYVQTHIHVLTHPGVAPVVETLGMLSHYAIVAVLSYLLPSVFARVLFLVGAYGAAGLLHVQITLSHFAMETYEGVGYVDGHHSWWTLQLAGTMDIINSPRLDWFHGGLNYQTVHHLYPRLPRYRLRDVSAKVAAACRESGATYHTSSFYEANRMVIRTLYDFARSNQQGSFLWDAFNVRG